MVDRCTVAYAACEKAWAEAGKALGGEDWLAELPLLGQQETSQTLANFRAIFQDVDEAG